MSAVETEEILSPERLSGPRQPLKRLVLFTLKYVLGISLIVWMVASGRVDLSVIGSLPASLVLQCLALMVVQSVLAALRVRYILAHQGIRTSVTQCLLFNCTGILYSAFLPGGISGDAVRAYLFMKTIPHQRLGILGALVLDRLLGLVSMVALGLGAAYYMAISVDVVRPYLLGFTALFLLLLCGLAALHFVGGRHSHHHVPLGRLEKIWVAVKKMVADLRIHHYGAGVLLSVVGQSVLIHLTAVGIIYLCSLHSRAGLDFLQVFVATPIGLLVNAVPLSPGGLGIGENAFELLYRAVGGSSGATSFLSARLFLYSPAAIGLAYVLKRMVTRKR